MTGVQTCALPIRLAEPSDIADLAVFLAGDRATYLTGQAYVADGGLTAGHL